ncbi:MAG: hypothetical protein U0Q19_23200 [Kineosporiaceae bacterium]
MTDQQFSFPDEQHSTTRQPAPIPQSPMPPASTPPVAAEHVGRGLIAAVGGVLAGVVVTVVLWRLGYVAAISGVVLALASVRLYAAAAGAPPRRGLVPLIGLIVLGAVVSFLAVVANDALDFYGSEHLAQQGVSRLTFLTDNLSNPSVLGAYGGDMAMFFLFVVLGAGGTIWQVVKGARAS